MLCGLRLYTKWIFIGRAITGYAGARRRVTLDQQGPTIVHLKPGPLQTIFDLLPDEVR